MNAIHTGGIRCWRKAKLHTAYQSTRRIVYLLMHCTRRSLTHHTLRGPVRNFIFESRSTGIQAEIHKQQDKARIKWRSEGKKHKAKKKTRKKHQHQHCISTQWDVPHRNFSKLCKPFKINPLNLCMWLTICFTFVQFVLFFLAFYPSLILSLVWWWHRALTG